MELGLYTFADIDPALPNKPTAQYDRIRQLLEEIELADQLGLDVFGVGEHHRADYAVSSPSTILAAAAVKTKNIRLTSAVTVLSSDDPVRVFHQFATVDQLSSGRAEIMAGRGSFIESFPLFGYNLDDYDALFEEKLRLLVQLNKEVKVSWKGNLRPSIDAREVYPRPFNNQLPIWLAVGGTPASVVRAANLGLPIAVAIIGGNPDRFKSFVQLYRDSFEKAGNDPAQAAVGINSIGYIAEDSKQAADEYFPAYAAMMDRIGKERGWQPMTRDHFDQMRSPHGSLLVGSPEEIINKIVYQYKLFKNDRFLMQMSVGNMDHQKILNSIKLFATIVAPAVKQEIAKLKNL